MEIASNGPRVKVETIKNHFKEKFIGESLTHIAIKNPKSYMIATWNEGLIIIDEGKVIYSARFPFKKDILRDLIYIKQFDSYFMDHDNQLYRKDINDKYAYVWMNIRCGFVSGGSFAYSDLNEKLIVNKDKDTISAVDLKAKKVEIEIPKSVGTGIFNFKIFGEKENQVAAITEDANVVLYELDYGRKKGAVVGHTKIDLIEDRKEKGIALGVGDKGQFLLVEIRGCKAKYTYFSSRVAVLKVNGKSLTISSIIDVFSQEITQKNAIEC